MLKQQNLRRAAAAAVFRIDTYRRGVGKNDFLEYILKHDLCFMIFEEVLFLKNFY